MPGPANLSDWSEWKSAVEREQQVRGRHGENAVASVHPREDHAVVVIGCGNRCAEIEGIRDVAAGPEFVETAARGRHEDQTSDHERRGHERSVSGEAPSR